MKKITILVLSCLLLFCTAFAETSLSIQGGTSITEAVLVDTFGKTIVCCAKTRHSYHADKMYYKFQTKCDGVIGISALPGFDCTITIYDTYGMCIATQTSNSSKLFLSFDTYTNETYIIELVENE